ncbi:tetratricopeptide repeat protein [Candidatus Poribacteria bacterium]|nr:tetratricopeptide repeat protein [Candidatus Poribacteria bacterium]MYH81314.1 tetratricopeptide repeat protein [Candidatus Poribacteria bacterium]MYK96975.1 tetratricopeptide repeat protein [Candidatus Poribacteria bacterium]
MLYPKFVKQTHRKKQKTHCLFALIAFTGLFFYQHLAHSQQYAIVDSENGDRLTGVWRGATDTHFEIEYQGQILRLPLMGHTLSFTSDIANVQDRTAAKYYRNGLALLELGLPELAQRRFESAIEEFPRYAAAHYQLGLLHETNGDNAKALERFRSVAILDAANFDLVPHLQELGNAALANEAYAEAVDSYQLILRHYPEQTSIPELSYITGFLLVEELEDYDTGLPLLESAIQQNSDTLFHEKAYFLIGKLKAKNNQLEDALHTLQGFIMRYRESEWVYEAHLIRAEVNLKLGRTAEAGNQASQVLEASADETIREHAKQILDQTRWKVYTVADGLPDNRVPVIASDDTRLWVGTPNGVMLFDTTFNNWIPIEEGPELINDATVKVPDVTAIAANGEEVWVGTRSQGAIHYNKLTREIQIYSPTDGYPAWVKDIKMDDTEIWFATDAGVGRKIRGDQSFVVYNKQQSFIPEDDIETLLLLPTTVWGASAKGDIVVTFDRKTEEWGSHRFTEIQEGTTIVDFDTAEDQILFTWYNATEKTNGYFRADLDGLNGKSTTLHTGIEDEKNLKNIYIRGILDNSPIVPAVNEAPPVETPDSLTPEASPETEALEVEVSPPPPPTPLVLWIATNETFYTHHTRSSDDWEYTTTPQIVSGELTIYALIVANNRVWIATSNGLASMDIR